jgi:hypothetical protein
MRKAWMATAAMLAALTTSGCVLVVSGDGDKDFNEFKNSDGFRVLDRDGSYSRIGGDIDLRGRVGGDLSLISGDVTADALEVGGDVSLAAGDVDFTGSVGGEASVAAGDVDWSADVGDELSIAAGELNVAGHIVGEASLAAGEMTLAATFDDGLSAAADEIYMAGRVRGELTLVAANKIRNRRRDEVSHGRIELSGEIVDGGEVCTRTLRLTSTANVSGTLRVWAEETPSIDAGADSGNLVFEARDGCDCDDILDR